MITIKRQNTTDSTHRVVVGAHSFVVDMAAQEGGSATGPDPHDLYDAALGACKALTALWFANRRGIPLEEIEVQVERDASAKRQGHYRLNTTLALVGPLTPEQRQMLLAAASNCPIHKLMTKVETVIETQLVDLQEQGQPEGQPEGQAHD
jgi:putative redox protein